MSDLRRHFTVYIPDLPGFGLSQPISGEHGVDEFIEFVESFAVKIGLKSFYLAGHSMGAAIAMRYAVKYPGRVKKLVIIDGVGVGKDMPLWVRLAATSALCRPIAAAFAKCFKAFTWISNKIYAPWRFISPLPLAIVFLGASLAVFANEADSLVLKLAALTIPTLLVWGARDKIIPVSNAYSASRMIPDCKLHIFENGGHSAYSREVNRFSALLADFLH